MSRLIDSTCSPTRTRFWIFGLCGTLGVTLLGPACGENTERVISKLPTASAVGGASAGANSAGNTSVGTGGNAFGGVNSTGGSSSGISSGGSTSVAGSSNVALKQAVGTPIGFAAVGSGGTSGGGMQPAVVVATCDDLQSQLQSGDDLGVVVVDKTIDCRGTKQRDVTTCELACDSTTGDTSRLTYRFLDSSAADCSTLKSSNSSYTAATPMVTKQRKDTIIYVRSNKTLLGSGPDATILGATLYLTSDVSNIIIQNLNLTTVNPDILELGDAITIDGANHVWVDHCYFKDISDGFVDAKSSASYITLSWNHFDGVNPSACAQQHNYADTIEGSTVTFHHNFYDHTLSCSPKVSKAGARAHLFNNYWLNVLYYSIQVASGAQALLQNNDFNESKRPYYGNSSCLESPATCAINVPATTPNRFEGVSLTESQDTGGTVDPLPYDPSTYQVEDSSLVATKVTQGAGPTLTIP